LDLGLGTFFDTVWSQTQTSPFKYSQHNESSFSDWKPWVGYANPPPLKVSGWDIPKQAMYAVFFFMFVANGLIFGTLARNPTGEIFEKYIVPQHPVYGMTPQEKIEYVREFNKSIMIRTMGKDEENHARFAAAQKDRFGKISAFLGGDAAEGSEEEEDDE